MSESKKPVGTLCAVVRDHHSDKEDAEKFLDLGPVWMTGKGNLRFEQEFPRRLGWKNTDVCFPHIWRMFLNNRNIINT